MDGFSYYNIFETKGLEYLIIIAFLLLLIPFSIILNRKVTAKKQFHHALGTLTSGILKIPQGIFYSRNHTWAHLSKSGIANLGLNDLLLHLTGVVRLNYLKTAGESITKGEVMTEICHDGKLFKIYSPISGKVVETNPELTENPASLIEDPYEAGWLYKIKPTNWKAETSNCYLAESATDWSKNELQRFRDFLSVTMPKYSSDPVMVTMQDGGELRDHLLAELPAELWNDFQREFLNP